MPIKNEIKRKEYMKLYYQTKLKTPTSRTYTKKEPTPPLPTEDDEEYNDMEYETEDLPSPPQKIVKPQSKNKINVDTEYTNYLRNREYIRPPPHHINPYIKNHIQHLKPTRPMMSQHNQNLPNKYIFL